MNPHTVQRLSRAFPSREPQHVLTIGHHAGTWPGTVYKAAREGWLRRVSPGMFAPTAKMMEEMDRQRRIKLHVA